MRCLIYISELVFLGKSGVETQEAGLELRPGEEIEDSSFVHQSSYSRKIQVSFGFRDRTWSAAQDPQFLPGLRIDHWILGLSARIVSCILRTSARQQAFWTYLWH